jgi:tRNA dimethylallyltransferase
MPQAKQKIVIIQGPTGAGKTAVALRLARVFPLEIINADSMQFYRHMDIGTSKPTRAEQEQAPHHLFSIVNPDEEFDAARFIALGRQVVADVAARGSLPLFVGGTGLYIRALTKGLFAGPGADRDIRESLRQEGKELLYARLQEVDPQTASRVSPNDVVRIVRALEVYHLTGEPISRQQGRHGFQEEPYNCLKIGLAREREVLYRRIEKRVDQMLQRGLLDEVRGLLDMGYTAETRPMQSIGYRQMTAYLTGRLGWSAAVAGIKQETRKLAKRQLTWLRHDPELVWVKLPEQRGSITGLIKKFLNVA